MYILLQTNIFLKTLKSIIYHEYIAKGGMAEWLKAPVSKAGNGATRSGVQIPLPPPSF